MGSRFVIYTFYFFFAVFGIQACQSKKKDNTEQVLRGKKLFKTYCVLCHGEKGDGKGRLAVGKIPPPANLTISKLTDAAKKKIITGGGESVGRSPFMPPWGQQLSEQEILDLIAYTNAIKIK